MLQNPLQASSGGGAAFVSKLNAAGSVLIYSTYLGGSGDDIGSGIAVDASGNAYVMVRATDTPLPSGSNPRPGHPYARWLSGCFLSGLVIVSVSSE